MATQSHAAAKTDWLRFILLAVAVVAVDQAIKLWLIYVFDMPARGVVEITGFFNLVMVWNVGVGFGLFKQDAQTGKYLLIAFSLAMSVGLTIWYGRLQGAQPLIRWALPLAVGGAIGNVIDRVHFGAVADFFDFHAFGWHFWAFNVADSAIVIGMCLILVDGLFDTAEQGKSG
ncbi:MAG: signal peptidase II [Alphaproteobacteria bacterium]